MAALASHAEERHAPPDGRLLRYAGGRPVTYRRYDGLWVRIGRYLPWVRTQQISTHWLRHTTLTWVERNFGYAIAHAYAGHTDGAGDTDGATSTYVRHAHRGRHRPRRPHRGTAPARRATRERGMTALADFPFTPARPRARRGPGSLGPGPAAVPDAVPAADRPGTARDQAKTMRSWPLLVLAVPAAAEVWSGWVGIAQKTGFGMVSLLPGIWSSLHLDTAVTLPVGVECYAAYALRAWLATGHAVSDRTRRFARRSAVFSFALGMAGQIAFHLMNQDQVTRAPGPSPPSCRAFRSWSWAWGPSSHTCCARTPQQPTAPGPTLPDQPLACGRRTAPPSSPGTGQTRIRRTGPDRRRAVSAGPYRDIAPE